MNSKIVEVIVAIVTLALFLGCLFGAFWGFFFSHVPMLGVVCLALAVGFGVFVRHDFKKYFGKNNATKS